MQIQTNPDEGHVALIRTQLRLNDGYCPCKIEKTPETKCMCQEFVLSKESGPCHCGLYIKICED